MRRFTFDSTGRLPERSTIEAAAEDWSSELPSVVYWTDYDADDMPTAQGSTAIVEPCGTVEYWRDQVKTL